MIKPSHQKFDQSSLAAVFPSEHIHGDRFVEVADWAITDANSDLERHTFDRNGIIFCYADRVAALFHVIRDLPFQFLLISHNSDLNITEDLYGSKPANVLHWFAQNVSITRADLTPIPIGLPRPHVVPTWDVCGNIHAQLLQGRPKRQNFCYLNINHHSNLRERERILWRLFWRFWFITARTKRVPYAHYVAEVARHRFVISPPGNGLDCHRTWESLYLGSVPIVKSSPGLRPFASAGLLMVDDLSTLTRRKITALAAQLPRETDRRFLYFSYWKQRILDTANKCLSGVIGRFSTAAIPRENLT